MNRRLYRLLFLHGVILMVGGHYTYARVPAGFRTGRRPQRLRF